MRYVPPIELHPADAPRSEAPEVEADARAGDERVRGTAIGDGDREERSPGKRRGGGGTGREVGHGGEDDQADREAGLSGWHGRETRWWRREFRREPECGAGVQPRGGGVSLAAWMTIARR